MKFPKVLRFSRFLEKNGARDQSVHAVAGNFGPDMFVFFNNLSPPRVFFEVSLDNLIFFQFQAIVLVSLLYFHYFVNCLSSC